MTTTFLTLVNDTMRRLNEVEVTSADFGSVLGFRAQVKDAVMLRCMRFPSENTSFPLTTQREH